MYTWESSVSQFSLFGSVPPIAFFCQRNGGPWGAETCQESLHRAGAEPGFGPNEWSIVESLYQQALTTPFHYWCPILLKSFRVGLPWAKHWICGCPLFPLPSCCVLNDWPTVLTFALAIRRGILSYGAGDGRAGWGERQPSRGSCYWFLGMPRYAWILGWTSTSSVKLGPAALAFVQTWCIWARLLNESISFFLNHVFYNSHQCGFCVFNLVWFFF